MRSPYASRDRGVAFARIKRYAKKLSLPFVICKNFRLTRRVVVIQRRVIAASTRRPVAEVILSHVLVNVRQDRNLRALRHRGATTAIINESPA